MKTEAIVPKNWDDIVFENRNKTYGAYLIRRIYSKHLVISAVLAIVIMGIGLAYPSLVELFKSDAPPPPPPNLTQVILDQPPPITPNQPPPPRLEVPPPVKTFKYVPPKVTEKEVVEEEEMPTIEELKQNEISTETVEGTGEVIFEEPVAAVVDNGDSDEIFTVVEQQAEFPGGMEAMIKFINKNIRYPSSARRMGVDGKVFVQFVVDKEGKISDVQVIKGISADCDKEAIRIVQAMPPWKPGKQNGRAVRSRFVLPLRFKLDV